MTVSVTLLSPVVIALVAKASVLVSSSVSVMVFVPLVMMPSLTLVSLTCSVSVLSCKSSLISRSAMLALAWLVHQVAGLLARVERDSLIAWSGGAPLDRLAEWVLDGMFITLCAWRSEIPAAAGVPWGITWFPPVVLFLLVRLLRRLQPDEAWTWWLGDRFLAGCLLAASSVLLPFDFTLRALVVSLIVAGLILAGRKDGPGSSLRAGGNPA